MKRIDSDIASGQFKNIYLLYGQEDYLKIQYKNKLIKALVNDGDEMNFSKYEDKGVNVPQIIDQAETMPFFADHRVILIENSGFGKKTPEDMAQYLSQVPEFTVLIFVESAMDKRSALYKAAKAAGRDIELNMPDERSLTIWVGSILKSSGKQMKKEAFAEFLSRTGDSMDNMQNELTKLMSYVGDSKQITLEDVTAVCTNRVESVVFDLVNAIAAKDLKKTMDLYQDMLSAKEPPMRILSLIVRQFKQMKIIKECMHHGENNATIAPKVGVSEFVVRKLTGPCNNFSEEDIRGLLEDAADMEQRYKTGRMDASMAVELIIMKYIK